MRRTWLDWHNATFGLGALTRARISFIYEPNPRLDAPLMITKESNRARELDVGILQKNIEESFGLEPYHLATIFPDRNAPRTRFAKDDDDCKFHGHSVFISPDAWSPFQLPLEPFPQTFVRKINVLFSETFPSIPAFQQARKNGTFRNWTATVYCAEGEIQVYVRGKELKVERFLKLEREDAVFYQQSAFDTCRNDDVRNEALRLICA
jgi:hypothetical protein